MNMQGLKILVVDDEKEFAETLAERLDLRGFETSVAHCGEDAMTFVYAKAPDVVVLDLKMPDMSGLEVLEEIKAHASDVAVIMLTGHGSTASGIEGMKRGAFDYMMKPVDIAELVEKIQQANNQRPSVRQQTGGQTP